jgi:pimeloyl-ACP methyl ester carboxylesterase
MSFERFHNEKGSVERAQMDKRTKDFDTLWDKISELEIGDEVFNIHDVQPEQSKSDVTVLIVPGWGLTPQEWKGNMKELAAAGRRTLAVDAVHGSKETTKTSNPIPEAANRKMTPFVKALEDRGISKTDAIAHSGGCIELLLAARESPDQFRTLVLVNPGGMIGEDSLPRLSARFAKEAVTGAWNAVRQGKVKEYMGIANKITHSAVTRPVLSFKEAQAVASTQVIDLLKDLKSKGINVVVIHGPSDPVFPMERMRKELQQKKSFHADEGGQVSAIMKFLDGVYSVAGGHTDFITNADTYTRLAEGAISALEVRDAK